MSKTPLQSDLEEIASFLGPTVKKLAGKTVLISGGCGFLGQHFTHLFVHLNKKVLEVPCKIIVADNFITASRDNRTVQENLGVTFIEHDVIKPLALNERLDYIIHLAGVASPYYYRKYPLETLEVATLGVKNLLKLGLEHQVKSFLFFSSSEIYGDPDPKMVPTKESYRGNVSTIGPRACYDESKRLGETLCSIFNVYHGVSTKIVRPFNVYGPGMRERDYRVLPNFASNIVGGKPLRIYGTGIQTRTFCYITDAINCFVRALLEGKSGEVYNAGNPEPEVSMIDLAKEIGIAVGRELKVSLVPYPEAYPPDEPMRRCPDITKAKEHLGFAPRITLREGLGRFMTWALATYTGTQEVQTVSHIHK